MKKPINILFMAAIGIMIGLMIAVPGWTRMGFSRRGAPTTAHYLTDQAESGLSAEVVVTTAGLALLDDPAASNQRTTLGLGAAAILGTAAVTNGATTLPTGDHVYDFCETTQAYLQLADKFTGGVTVVTRDADATPEVAHGGFYTFTNTGALTITDFVDTDGDHSEFSDGDWFMAEFADADITVDFSANANIEGNVGRDYTADASQITYALFVYRSARWNCPTLQSGMSNPTTHAMSSLDMSSGTSLKIPTTTSGDQTLTASMIGLKTDEDMLVTHGGAAGECQDEVGLSLLTHISVPIDPSAYYDQEATYRVYPLFTVGDDFPHGFTLTEWSVTYVGGDPTTELDADLCFDTTPDYNPAAGMTIMDVIDTTAGTSSADSGFDSATAANASKVYIRFGADPTDANVVIHVDIWGYAEED